MASDSTAQYRRWGSCAHVVRVEVGVTKPAGVTEALGSGVGVRVVAAVAVPGVL